MTPPGYLRMLARHWVVLLVPVACGIVLGAGYLATTPPRYQATSQLYFTAPDATDDSLQLVDGLLFLRSRMPSYAALVTSPLVTDAAIRQAHLPFGSAELTARTAVDQPDLTTLLDISVTDTDPRRAAAAADALATAVGGAVLGLDAARPAGQAAGAAPVSVRQTRPARPPTRPGWPQPWAVLAAGGLLGLVAGLLAAAGRHTRDSAVRGRAGVLRATGLDALAVIPRDTRPGHPVGSRARSASGQARAEATTGLRTALQHGDLAAGGNVLAIASARPADGRTSVAVDLCYALALAGSDVVLVETDLRRPAIARLLRLGYGPGLANVLLGQFAVQEVLVPFRTRAMSVLTAGWSAQDTSELLSSPAMAGVLAALRRDHDHVIVDLPAATSVRALELAAAADAVLVVVRHDRTPGQAAAELIRSLRRMRVRIAGVVLTAGPSDAVEAADQGREASAGRTAHPTATGR